MKNSNVLYKKRNLLILEKLLKNINIEPNKVILQEAPLPSLGVVSALKALEKLASQKSPLGKLINLVKNYEGLDFSTHGLDANDLKLKFEQAIEQIFKRLEDPNIKRSRRYAQFAEYSDATTARFLNDPNVDTALKEEFIQLLEQGSLKKADQIKTLAKVGDSDFQPHFQKFNLDDFVFVMEPAQGAKKAVVQKFLQLVWAGENYVKNMTKIKIPPDLELIANLIELEGDIATNSEVANKLILKHLLGEAEYDKQVMKFTYPEQIPGRRTPNPIEPQNVTTKMIIESLDSSKKQLVLTNFRTLQNALKQYFFELGVDLEAVTKFSQSARENYKIAMDSSVPSNKKLLIKLQIKAVQAGLAFMNSWAFPYKPTSFGLVPKLVGVFSAEENTRIWRRIWNPYQINPKANWMINLTLGVASYWYRQLMFEVRNFAEGYEQDVLSLDQDIAELEDSGAATSEEISSLRKELTNLEYNSAVMKKISTSAYALYLAPGAGPRGVGDLLTWLSISTVGKGLELAGSIEPKKSEEVEKAEGIRRGAEFRKFVELSKMIISLKYNSLFTGIKDEQKKQQMRLRIEQLIQNTKDTRKEVEGFFQTSGVTPEQYANIKQEYISIIKELKQIRETEGQTEKVKSATTTQTPAAPASSAPADKGPADGL